MADAFVVCKFAVSVQALENTLLATPSLLFGRAGAGENARICQLWGTLSMASPLPASPKVMFGAFELDAAAGKLFKSGIPIKLQPQPLRVLLLLTERPGQVVTREEIQRCLWGDSTFVDFERGINFSVNQIRGALSDNAEKPRYIETLPRIGYRFIAPVSNGGLTEPAIPAAASVASARVYEWPEESTTTTSTSSEAQAPSSPPVPVPQRKRTYALSLVVAALVIFAALGYSAHRWWSRSRGLDLQNIQITKLTDCGTVSDAAISSDGRFVVYAKRDGEKEGLWMRQVATRSDAQILPPENISFHGLAFSPDGNYVYFVRTDPNDPFFKYLYVMPSLGGPARKLFTDVDSPVSFSPDNHQYVYERCIAADNHIELRIANADEPGDKMLATVPNASCFMYQPGPSWSPDGRTITVPVKHFGEPERWVLHAVSVADRHVRELYSSPTGIGRPVWLLHGNALIVPHYDPAAHRSQLWTISYPKGEARRLTNDLNDYDASLDMTRRGDTVAAIAGAAVSNVWVFAGADSLRGRQITSGNLAMFSVSEAPGGKFLSTSVDGEVWTTNSDGSQHAIFADVHGTDWIATCTRSVVLTADASGAVMLMRVEADGSNATKIASGSLWSPACSPDGRFVSYVTVDSPQKIWRIPIEGGTAVQIAEILGDSVSGRMDISPDGRFIAYPYTRYSTPPKGWALVVIPANGGPPVKTFQVPGSSWGTRWSPQGTGLQYLLTQNGTTNIWEQPLAGGDPKQITKFTSGRIFDFNWTADGKQLLVTRGEVSSDVVLLSNLR
jgi:DNA-binding winged helix-turn-helix (wHTH) protein/Tol biopolymer transport system component